MLLMAPGHLHHERGGRGRTLLDAVVVHAALVAHGTLAEQAQVAARAARAARLERGGLQQDVHRPVRDLGVQAAHDARERHGTELRRGDDRHIGRERAILAVERSQALAFGGRAHHDMRHAVRILELVQVECVQRLAEQEQDIVRHVHDVVDGALADSRQALDHPVGARPDLDPADDARGVTRAAHRVLDGDPHRLVDGRRGGVQHELARHAPERALVVGAVHGAHLARHAHHGKAVGTVRRDLQVEHRVGELREIGDGHAYGRVLGQDPDARMIAAHPQLALRAAHAAAGNAAQLRLLDLEVARQHRAHGGHRHLDARRDVRRAAHDLHGVDLRVLLSWEARGAGVVRNSMRDAHRR